ncbi:YkvA family protein [Flexivirga meconopsidis]|uniref:YkvA family protein n=1 Tax=Flexivirga meconopsidis TaxID=2977121 RepID=UPI00223EEAD8|nr:YkvA family protein [Flexivirga meconopsidis]
MAAPALRWASLRRVARALQEVSRPGGPSVAARLACLPRMTKAVAKGEYSQVSPAHLALVAAAAAYVASPVDLLPEALLGVIGLADDALVLSWLATTLVEDTDAYLTWEQARRTTVKGERLS